MTTLRTQVHQLKSNIRDSFVANKQLWIIVVLLELVQSVSTVMSQDSRSAINIVVFVVFCMLTILIPYTTRVCCTALLWFWSLAQFLPGFNGSPYFITVCSCVALLVANYPFISALSALGGSTVLLLLDYAVFSARDPSMGSELLSSILLAILGLAISAVIGLSIKQNYTSTQAKRTQAELTLNREHVARLQRDALLASRLHDGLTNDLSYLITLAANEAETTDSRQRTAWSSVTERTQDAFTKAHEIIDILNNSPSDSSTDPSTIDNSSYASDLNKALVQNTETSLFLEELRNTVTDNAQQLEQLGYTGSTGVNAQHYCRHINNRAKYEALQLVNELFANIRRHCDTREDYSLHITVNEQHLTIIQMNSLEHSQRHQLFAPSGKGLAMHRRTIQDMHGTLRTSAEDETWILQADLPLQ